MKVYILQSALVRRVETKSSTGILYLNHHLYQYFLKLKTAFNCIFLLKTIDFQIVHRHQTSYWITSIWMVHRIININICTFDTYSFDENEKKLSNKMNSHGFFGDPTVVLSERLVNSVMNPLCCLDIIAEYGSFHCHRRTQQYTTITAKNNRPSQWHVFRFII